MDDCAVFLHHKWCILFEVVTWNYQSTYVTRFHILSYTKPSNYAIVVSMSETFFCNTELLAANFAKYIN
jgi:hypothetical protein